MVISKKIFPLIVLVAAMIYGCKDNELVKNTSGGGVVWNIALDQPFVDLDIDLVDTEKDKIVQTLTTNATGNIDFSQKDLSDKSYLLRIVPEDENYPWYALPTELELNASEENVIVFKNYREGEFFLDIQPTLGVYDSVNVIEVQSNLSTSYNNTYTANTSETFIRPEGTWDYQITYYRDTIDSVVTFSQEIIRKSSFALGAGQNELIISY